MASPAIALATALAEAFLKLEPVAQKEVVALINHLRGERKQPPVPADWDAITAHFEADLARTATLQAASSTEMPSTETQPTVVPATSETPSTS